jgi:glycosyltransferase involved in cell wall biosynthesis
MQRSAEESEAPRTVDLSVVIPLSERWDDLAELHRVYAEQLRATSLSHEILYVLDGRRPEALEQLRELRERHPEVHVFLLNRWFGEATAMSVGFAQARGKVVLTLPSYLQVEPEEIGRMLRRFAEGQSDLLISWRNPRVDSRFNQWQSKVFHWLVGRLTGVRYHDLSCGVRVMRPRVAREVHLYGDLHRFFPLLAFERGFRIEEMAVRQSRADSGRRVYGLGVYLRRVLDVLTLFFLFKFTKKPLRFFGLVGSSMSAVGAVIVGYLGIYRILGIGPIAGRPLLILGVLLLVLGIQLFSIGLLGEVIIFAHGSRREEYTVEEFLE